MSTFRSSPKRRNFSAVVAIGWLLVPIIPFGSAWGDDGALGDDGAVIDYDRQIRPILSDKCYACHGPNEASREGGFRLDQKASAFAEADSGSRPIVPHDCESSEVCVRLVADDEDLRMPPPDSGKRLTPTEIQLVRQWIEQGAAWREHWAFIPPRQSDLPVVKNKAWPKTPVDVFILDRLEREGLAPSPPADKRTLIRRVTLNLTGLPPTLNEVDDFLGDDADDAYERVVDRLLDSQSYGEHMARYWLDAARYGDTHGLHLDNYREIWPYRDWVVKAFNDNLPFDQFVMKQLAGDLLAGGTVEDLIATGFNRCHVTTNEGGSITEEVYVRNVVDRVVTTGTVFLGMTFECTRCHDHKYDPVTMRDFYSMFAFFNSLDGDAMDGNSARHEPTVRVPTAAQTALADRLEADIARVKMEICKAIATVELKPTAVAAVESSDPATDRSTVDEHHPSADVASETADYSLAAWLRAKRDEEQTKRLPEPIVLALQTDEPSRTSDQRLLLRDYFVEHIYAPARETFAPLQNELQQLERSLDELNKQIPATLVFRERVEPRPSFVLHRGEYDQRREEVSRATPIILPPLPEQAPLNRLGLSQWLVSPSHPLTARVTVNRFWQQLFGTGLVKTAEDFGSQGEPPSHPALLDWLAVQFQTDGWDVKATMKRLVMSATYQQTSRITPLLRQRDPANRLLARGPRYRLDAEMLRDQALAISGLLVNQLGGPSVKPPQPDGLWYAVGYSGSNTVRFKPDETPDKIHRRTLYTFIKRTSPPPQMSTFDGPSREMCSVRRERTNTPLQALLLLNDTQFVEAARGLAERVMGICDLTPRARATRLFELATLRPPDDAEIADLISAYQDHLQTFEADIDAARALVKVGISPPAATDQVSALAAWTMIANLVLNLDEVVNVN